MNHNFEALCSTLAYGYDPAIVPKLQNRDDGILLIGNFILLIRNQKISVPKKNSGIVNSMVAFKLS
jgi:hypothetical protein